MSLSAVVLHICPHLFVLQHLLRSFPAACLGPPYEHEPVPISTGLRHVLLLFLRMSPLAFLGCSVFGVTCLFRPTETNQVSPEASWRDPHMISGTWKRFQLRPDTEQAPATWDWSCHCIPTLRVPLPSSCNAHTSVTSPR